MKTADSIVEINTVFESRENFAETASILRCIHSIS